MKKAFTVVMLMLISGLPMLAFAQSNPLIGAWQLTGAYKILPDGKQVNDYGDNPKGIAIFTPDGHYVIEIFRSERKRFTSNDKLKGTPEEYKDAVLSNSCHFGTYMVDMEKGTITLHVDCAGFPNWDGTVRVSDLQLKDNHLSWKSLPRPDGSVPVTAFQRMP